MKLQMKREALEKINRQANQARVLIREGEMNTVLKQARAENGFGIVGRIWK